jgi:hypothetical protein
MFFKMSAIILSANFFQNPEEFLQGIFFVREQTKGQTWVSGSLNWPKLDVTLSLRPAHNLRMKKTASSGKKWIISLVKVL